MMGELTRCEHLPLPSGLHQPLRDIVRNFQGLSYSASLRHQPGHVIGCCEVESLRQRLYV